MKKILILIAFVCLSKIGICQQNVSMKETVIDATFKNGKKDWDKYLEKNIDATIVEKNKVPKGTYKVLINFVIGKDSLPTEIEPITKYGYGMEDEAIRVIKNCPKWVPASFNGHYVKQLFQQPIIFYSRK